MSDFRFSGLNMQMQQQQQQQQQRNDQLHGVGPTQNAWLDPSYHETQEQVASISGSRVCDRCMVKKIKCNRARPSCSRCLEEDTPCIYSAAKKKPGPVKGSRRKKSSPNEAAQAASGVSKQESNSSQVSDPFTEMLQQQIMDGSLAGAVLAAGASEPTSGSGVGSPSYPMANNQISPLDVHLQPEQERRLLDDYFTYLQPSMPLFDQEKFFQRYNQGLLKRELLLTLVTVAAQIQGYVSFWAIPSLKSCLDQLLSVKVLEEETVNEAVSIDGFQQACLLAFYEFHQHPGQKAWLRISQLTRRAYQCGLHQIDNPDQCLLYELNPMTEEDKKEWRRLWWCIYCLDSYSNITAATPFIVELDSVRTALPAVGVSDIQPLIFLPSDVEDLWRTVKEILAQSGDTIFHIHIITTTLLRETGTLARLWNQNATDRLRARLRALEDHLSAIKLALPTRYLDVTKHVMNNESNYEHHARLITVLHLHGAQILIGLPRELDKDPVAWMQAWTQILEYCEDTMTVVKQWKAQICLSVDPAICFVVSGVSLFLHLHLQMAKDTDVELKARLRAHQNILLLFLEQFASIWQLPRFMLGPVTPAHVDGFLRRSQGQLHQSYLKLLSMTSDDLSPPEQLQFDRTFLSDSDFNDWGSWANAPNMNFM